MSAEGSGLVPGDHPDRIKWNAKYSSGFVPSFRPNPLAPQALALGLPEGPVADLACGPSGAALLAVFAAAAAAVADGGVLAWEAYTDDARRTRPGLPPEWCLAPGEPASLLPPEFSVLDQSEIPGRDRRRLLARRAGRPRTPPERRIRSSPACSRIASR